MVGRFSSKRTQEPLSSQRRRRSLAARAKAWAVKVTWGLYLFTRMGCSQDIVLDHKLSLRELQDNINRVKVPPYSGGAVYVVGAQSIQFNFVNFRGNKAAQNPGNDVMFSSRPTPLITSETIVGCTSTSDSPRLRVLEEAVGTDDFFPTPTTTPSVDSCESPTIDSDTAEFTLKMSELITGTVLVLIDNSGGTRTPTTNQAPNIGRVLSFSFDNSDSSSCCVSLGENGLVQTPLFAYKVNTSSFVGSFILSAKCVLDESEENALFTISGRNVPSGILSVTLSDNTVLDLEFGQKQTTSEVLTVPLTRIHQNWDMERHTESSVLNHKHSLTKSLTYLHISTSSSPTRLV
ncbi:hypothetical protein BLNAU_24282 [Blattamonas nauphoetae]|uniref:Uncharacterized protein n=1 Tax=Blattamonas nauphoetae TaxID=2049346 RepID=A0ABQ9WMV8_9EUKA|nr:hypothetical protein BLNAU_24282 [Blattamonas nauphoetae]